MALFQCVRAERRLRWGSLVKALPLFLSASTLAAPMVAFAVDEEAVDISAEKRRLAQELAAVDMREGLCLQAALALGNYNTSSGSSSYENSDSSTFDSSASSRGQFSRVRGSSTAARDRTYSSTSSNVSSGSASGSASSNYSTQAMRAAPCQEQARSSREAILASVTLADTNPQEFTRLIRERRIVERAERAQWDALFEQSRPALRSDLDALAAAPPSQAGLEPFAERLESLRQRLMWLWKTAPPGNEHQRTFAAVYEAIQGFGAARDKWAAGHPEQVAQWEEAVQEARQRLAQRPSSPVMQAEVNAQEHNLKLVRSRLAGAAKQSDGAWRNALPVANAALNELGK